MPDKSVLILCNTYTSRFPTYRAFSRRSYHNRARSPRATRHRGRRSERRSLAHTDTAPLSFSAEHHLPEPGAHDEVYNGVYDEVRGSEVYTEYPYPGYVYQFVVFQRGEEREGEVGDDEHPRDEEDDGDGAGCGGTGSAVASDDRACREYFSKILDK